MQRSLRGAPIGGARAAVAARPAPRRPAAALFGLGGAKTAAAEPAAPPRKRVVRGAPPPAAAKPAPAAKPSGGGGLLGGLFGGGKGEGDVIAFRYDPAMQRYVRAPKGAVQDESFMTITPKSGSTYTVWPVMFAYLVQKKLRSVDQDEALALMKRGATLLDVRMAADFAQERAAGAVNAPLFQLTAGDAAWDRVKKVITFLIQQRPVERNPAFVADASVLLKNNKRAPVIVMCSRGGSLDTVVRVAATGKFTATDKDHAFGRETRSLKACYELMRAGYTNVVHLKGGLNSWRYEGYATEP